MNLSLEHYLQRIAYARASLWAPFYAVAMVARIQGDVPTAPLKAALRKLQALHPPLASRVRMEANGAAWLTTEGVGEFPLEVRPKGSDDDWARVLLEQERVPFPFDRGPVTRFVLLRGAQNSDLLAIAPHVVCDGYSMCHVMSDAVTLLNDPGRTVTRPSPPPAVSWQSVPHSVYDNLLLRGLVRIVNCAWRGTRIALNQEEYQQLHRQYWARQQNAVVTFALSRSETSDLVARCRQHGVSVTSALVAAFLLAGEDVRPSGRAGPGAISVAVNIRDRLIDPPGHAVGVYASSVDLRIRSGKGTPFWALAREGHTRIHKAVADRAQVLRTLVLEELDPSIADALVAAVSTGRWGHEFDLMTRFVRIKGEVRFLNVSNIGRVALPDVGAPYRLEALLPFPPLVPGGELALNVLTVREQMNVVLKYAEHHLSGTAVSALKERALGYVFGA